MMTFEKFEKACFDGLVKDRKSDDPAELKKYIKEEDSQAVLRQFYDLGVDRYKKNQKHDENLAFGYCISTAVENLSLMY